MNTFDSLRSLSMTGATLALLLLSSVGIANAARIVRIIDEPEYCENYYSNYFDDEYDDIDKQDEDAYEICYKRPVRQVTIIKRPVFYRPRPVYRRVIYSRCPVNSVRVYRESYCNNAAPFFGGLAAGALTGALIGAACSN